MDKLAWIPGRAGESVDGGGPASMPQTAPPAYP